MLILIRTGLGQHLFFFKKKKNCIIAGPHIDPPNQSREPKNYWGN